MNTKLTSAQLNSRAGQIVVAAIRRGLCFPHEPELQRHFLCHAVEHPPAAEHYLASLPADLQAQFGKPPQPAAAIHGRAGCVHIQGGFVTEIA